jgi:hypothetical protein
LGDFHIWTRKLAETVVGRIFSPELEVRIEIVSGPEDCMWIINPNFAPRRFVGANNFYTLAAPPCELYSMHYEASIQYYGGPDFER